MEQNNNNLIKGNTPRDLFLHLFVIITLYWSTVSFITLIWQYINYFFPDVLEYNTYYTFSGAVKFSIASLMVIFPIFLFLSFYLNKIYIKEPEVRDSEIRKWLIYFTLFVAGIIMIGDLIVVINNFLSGEITTRFILKALTLFLISGIIFWYYLNDIKNKISQQFNKYLSAFLVLIILIFIIAGFVIFGSPALARKIRLDERKISDLQNIQYRIFSYSQTNKALPPNLEVLKDPFFGYALPKDPQTQNDYEYNIKDEYNLVFELCAVFNEKTPKFKEGKPAPYPMTQENWEHDSGRFCFERRIELYAPKNELYVPKNELYAPNN
jgi:hypothetical protein